LFFVATVTKLAGMTDRPPNRPAVLDREILPPGGNAAAPAATQTAPAQAALKAAQALASHATAAATLRAYKADWTHFAAWCAANGFIPVPAAPATVRRLSGAASSRALRSG
jgi:hypothetical protein